MLGPVELVTLLILITRFIQPLLDAGDLGGSVRMIRRMVARIEAVLAAPTLSAGAGAAVADASVEFEAVAFGYEPEHPVLQAVSSARDRGTMTALVGPSGASKTTIPRHIGRFWDVTDCRVLIGGADVRDLLPDELMRRLSFVFQDVYPFQGTIRDNILLAKPDATPAELDRAVRLARVDEIAARLPDGLDAQVGEAALRDPTIAPYPIDLVLCSLEGLDEIVLREALSARLTAISQPLEELQRLHEQPSAALPAVGGLILEQIISRLRLEIEWHQISQAVSFSVLNERNRELPPSVTAL